MFTPFSRDRSYFLNFFADDVLFYMSIPRPDLRRVFLFFFFRRICLVVHSTYIRISYVHKCLEEEGRVQNHLPVWDLCTLRPPRLFSLLFSVASTTNLIGHSNIFTSFVDHHKNITLLPKGRSMAIEQVGVRFSQQQQ